MGTLVYVSNLTLYSQVREDISKYDPHIKFTDGIYLSSEDFFHDDPILKSHIITNIDTNNKNFFEILLLSPIISYNDKINIVHEVERRNIWGITYNGTTYINYLGMFTPLIIAGRISFFFADKYYTDYHYHFHKPVPFSKSYKEIFSLQYTVLPSNPEYSIIYSPKSKETMDYLQFVTDKTIYESLMREKMPYLLDIETGEILEASIRNIKSLLQRDERLYNEYNHLNRRQKKDLLPIYVMKYNASNRSSFETLGK